MNIIKTKLQVLPFGATKVTDGYCANALEKEVSYLLSLQEGRLLAGFYENADLRTSYTRYGGWESGLIGGHTLGHYLTAVAQGAVNTGVSEEKRAALYGKMKSVVDSLAECQAHSKGEKGFLWGAPPAKAAGVEAQFDNVERGKTNIKREAWVPWYTMHKLLAGLIDAYRLTGYEKALFVASELGDWVYRRASNWSTRLRHKVLSVEYGGMNDCLYDLYLLTNKEDHAFAAHLFDEEKLFTKILSEEENVLKDKHANTTIPKIIGALKRYLVLHGRIFDGKKVNAGRYLRVAERFWEIVVERHTYATGGNSEWEHFGKDYVLDSKRTNCNCETCNVYNMLKLTRMLYCVTGEKKYTDYYDNAFVNSILSSQNPETGMTTYFQPMASGFFKVYSRPYDKFWCCTGTGMENFTKLGDSVYYTDGKNLYLEQYLSSVVSFGGNELSLSCNFPLSDMAEIQILRAEEPFLLYLRIPDWAAEYPVLKRGDKEIAAKEREGHLCVRVQSGDALAIKIPVTVTMKGLPDGRDAFAFQYGGAVLSADLGTENMTESVTGVEVTVPAKKIISTERLYFDDLMKLFENPSAYLKREGDAFYLTGADVPLKFGLHYRRYKERYAIYLRCREGKRADDSPEGKELREPFDSVQPGYGQYETDELHAMKEKNSVALTANGSSRYAKSGGYFSYDFAVDCKRDHVLSVGLLRKDNGKTLKITADGSVVFAGWVNETQGEESYRREFDLPAHLIAEKARKKIVDGKEIYVLNLRFEGLNGRASARLFEAITLY